MASNEVPEIDIEHANAARIYDYLLGGSHNFAVDRQYATAMLDRIPEIAQVAYANRTFLQRAVTYCLDTGIDQFLDLGSGILTVGNVHEIARRRDPTARVAYVDIEPVAVAHSRELVADLPTVTITQADLRDVDAVLKAPGVAGLIDFTRPVAILAVAALHYVSPTDDLVAILDAYRTVITAGSALVFSHGSDDFDDPVVAQNMRAIAEVMRTSATPGYIRSRAELAAALSDFDLVEPGLVDIQRWHSTSTDREAGIYCAVGHSR